MNPAITLAMWRYRAFPGSGVAYYVVAQMAGSALGPIVARVAWGSPVARTPVVYAALQPARGWTFWGLFPVEAATVAVIVLAVGLFLSAPRLAGSVPYLVGFLVGAAIAGLGTITGGSANPARQFGPAIASGRTHLLLAYILAPLFGALIAPQITNRFRTRSLSTRPVRAIRPAFMIRLAPRGSLTPPGRPTRYGSLSPPGFHLAAGGLAAPKPAHMRRLRSGETQTRTEDPRNARVATDARLGRSAR